MADQALPALIALLFKVILLAYAFRAPRRDSTTRLFMALLILFSAHNLVEFIGFNNLVQHGLDRTTEICGYLYFAIGIPFLALVLHLSLRLSTTPAQWEQWGRYVYLLYVPVPILEFLLLGTDKLVSGFTHFGQYTILRTPGPLYFLFETYAPLYLLASLVYLAYGARASRMPVISRLRNRWWLAALLPFVLLNVYLIVANHFGLAKLSSSVFNPIAITIFLAITTYATHQYRLFDIEFFIPWSKVRQRKTVFYQRIQATVTELADLRSADEALSRVANILRCPVALVGGWRPVLAHAGEGSIEIAQFPHEPLEKLDRIVVANEIEQALPELHRTMTQFRVAAIVPFYPHSRTAASFLLLGDSFNESVYTPLDFRKVERLFDSLAEFFLDRIAFLRAELAESQAQTRDANEAVEQQRKELARVQEENTLLRDNNFRLLRENHVARKTLGLRPPSKSAPVLKLASERRPDWSRPLSQRMEEEEAKIISEALKCSKGNKSEAARLLGISPSTLHYKLERFGLAKSKKDQDDDTD